MPDYDAEQFAPPAPVASVTLRNLENDSQVSDVPMLLDSGADVTLVPQTAVVRLGITINQDSRYEWSAFELGRVPPSLKFC